jgi:chromosomal replication initiation ATPase DnaA
MLSGRYRFDTYVVGASNRLAVSAARAVAESPGGVYNPLFVYSNSGLGKTHLLAAIGHHAVALNPGLTVRYLTLDDFVEQLHSDIASGQADAFKRRYQGIGMLLLDDVQFLTGRVETQSEVLRLFNAMQISGRQIVMASDRAPSEIADVDERLLTRLSGGLIVDIAAPDYETRVAILRHKCDSRSLEFAEGVIEELARSETSNVRELEGDLNRLLAHQSATGSAVAPADVWTVLGGRRAPTAPDEFDSFLSDIASTVARSVDAWRVRLGERIAYWSGQGFRTGILEQALDADDVPDVAELDASFATVAERLRALEAEAIRADARLTGHPAFRDPDRLHEAEELATRAIALADPPPAPRPGFRLHDLVRWAGNSVVLQTVAGIINDPGARYNPLFVKGPAGAGKTHLAHAIGNALATRDRGSWTIACLTGAAFMDELIAALQSGTVERWRARYRAVDALIVDDIHALDGKERTQEEFFHLFNVLHRAGRQMVFTSDRALEDFAALEPRLRSRFEGGLVMEMTAPPLVDRSGRLTPVSDGDEAAAPNIDVPTPRYEPAEDSETDDVVPAATESLDVFFLDPEKVIADWPEVAGRVIEDWT